MRQLNGQRHLLLAVSSDAVQPRFAKFRKDFAVQRAFWNTDGPEIVTVDLRPDMPQGGFIQVKPAYYHGQVRTSDLGDGNDKRVCSIKK